MRSHNRSLMHAHKQHTHVHIHSLHLFFSPRPSTLLKGEKGRYYIGGILVLARLGPRQFWEWSSKNSRGKSCLCAAAATAAAEQLPALLLLRPHRRRPTTNASRGLAFSVPSSSRDSVVRPRHRYRALVIAADILVVREFAVIILSRGRERLSFFALLPLALSLSRIEETATLLIENRGPRHFCDYPRRSSRRSSYNIHPLSRFRWRFTNSVCRWLPRTHPVSTFF